jgi:pimeloyl-ACP methyl ester carboxylesterase
MATFVLVPGAGGVAWYWHRVVPLLEEAKHDAIAVDLPGDDEQAGLSAYSDRVVEAIGTRLVVLVAQSLGGFAAPLVCAQVRVRMLVFVNAMIPVPGETAGEWWDNTGSTAARIAAARRRGYSTNFDLATYFLHDVPPEIVKQGEAQQRSEADIVFGEPCRFEAWPKVPIHVIAGRDDRFFPIDFQRRLARERLHVTVDELAGGHLLALSNPRGLVDQLLGYLRAPS